jgi:hypothetical protein
VKMWGTKKARFDPRLPKAPVRAKVRVNVQ